MNPMTHLPREWVPSPPMVLRLREEFGADLDLNLSLRRFRNHYAEGQTSRNWDAKFENWVIADHQRLAAKRDGGTDDQGNPRSQRKTSVVTPLSPGDEGYVDPAEIIRAAVEAARSRPQPQGREADQ